MILIDLIKDKNKLSFENMKIRKCKLEVEQEREALQNDLRELQSKYIELLEQKSEQFDLYLKYQEQCVELANEKRELKKQLAEKNELCNSLSDSETKLFKTIEKLERKIKRLENKNEKGEI